ncbi:tetratricopeptide repeat protein [Luteibacter aegosomatis]|uniref:tetratricopeptide repeat protein n=1 Tax=Luteibacter aegosomatis TaxID=2911537 RepID=UPI001FFBB4C3|nr:tetratricopeptide repeat protein [Luteibacter aegosomatis]UPG84548.1 tetratricopeptide repeat protein [Luteibacter aegosomatis]
MNKPLFAFLLIALTSAAVHAGDSPKDVQALIGRGDYAGAEAALRQVVSEHPNSAKAHYVLAEVLAHEGNIGEAKAEASKAASLDPATHFTDPAKFQHFQRELDAALAPASRSHAGASPVSSSVGRQAEGRDGSSSHLTGILIAVVVIALIAFFWTRRRRDTASAFNGYPPPPPMNAAPPYGGGYPGYAPPPSSGVGAAVAAGLGGLAAGALLDEAFRSHRDGEETRDVGAVGTPGDASQSPSSQAYDDLRNEPIDMGNDNSSWDDGSSSDSGDFDDNQW